ncbi:hypothetical protein FIBSPDRAFT_889782 [Athelia psychrophila]|uniref:Uncharacterized protein n=1 Tax=Athelia psychrophila TaxID=1759441 RepID=A0A166LMY6_9AGAM|nr:hypothetical protein FIBSPDRAFT_889782 [Fibularhizoctonia sp. CBS 109695]
MVLCLFVLVGQGSLGAVWAAWVDVHKCKLKHWYKVGSMEIGIKTRDWLQTERLVQSWQCGHAQVQNKRLVANGEIGTKLAVWMCTSAEQEDLDVWTSGPGPVDQDLWTSGPGPGPVDLDLWTCGPEVDLDLDLWTWTSGPGPGPVDLALWTCGPMDLKLTRTCGPVDLWTRTCGPVDLWTRTRTCGPVDLKLTRTGGPVDLDLWTWTWTCGPEVDQDQWTCGPVDLKSSQHTQIVNFYAY